MRTHTRYIRLFPVIVAASGLLLTGCVDKQDNLPAETTSGIKVHPAGWSQPSSSSFHGTAIREANWNLNACKTCHGGQYSGGTSKVSCLTCHTQAQGPEDCMTCHGTAVNAAPPKDTKGNTTTGNRGVGAHQSHLNAAGAKDVACAECHTVPATVDLTGADGHLDATTGAEVVFNGALAGLPTTGVTPNPVYMSSSATCATTYCHGSFKNGNQSNAPVWNSAAGTGAQCGTCHGDATKSTPAQRALPGGTHPQYTECQWCHTSVSSGPVFTNADLHIDGTVPLFQWTTQADCSRCHGSASNAAPPKDLAGATTSAKVGAHQAHLNPSKLTSIAVACTECHTVPAILDYTGADGHLDATAGAEIKFGSFASISTANNTVIPNPAYNATSMSCGSTYCHGTFKQGNLTQAPVWNDPATSACGTCHGDPTSGNPNPGVVTGSTHSVSNNCQFCHSVAGGGPVVSTYNATAGTWTIDNKGKHMDGKLSLFGVDTSPWP